MHKLMDVVEQEVITVLQVTALLQVMTQLEKLQLRNHH